jgi:RHS repeat-associated protein
LAFSYGHDAGGKTTTIGISQPAFEWLPSLSYARSYGVANELNQIGSAGGVGIGWNADGNMTSDGVNTYSWGYGNRMIGASRKGMTAAYDYDSDDRRTKKTVNGVVTRTLWSGADELAEYDANGDLIRRFVPDGTGAMDARLATVTAAGAVYWYHVDHQGTVIATSDSAGQTVGTASYSPYGEFGAGTSAPPQYSPFGYTGRQYDPETGLYQYLARYYSPRLGQFLSMDPIGTKDDPNLFLYVGLDPVNATDPTGMQSVYTEVHLRRRDIGDAAADRQNREAADRFVGGVRAIINDIKNDPIGAAADGLMIAGDIFLGGPTGEAAIGIAARRGAREGAEAVAEGVVYRRTNTETGRCYIGRCNSDQLYSTRQRAHDRAQGTRHEYEVLERAQPGQPLREAEQRHIDANGGPTNRSNPNGGLENRRHEIDPRRRRE